MARVTRFHPDNSVHPLSFDRKATAHDGAGGHVGLVMAVGVVALLLGGLVLHASAEPASNGTAAPAVTVAIR